MQQLINAYESNEIYISSSQTVISKKLVTLMFSVKTNIFNAFCQNTLFFNYSTKKVDFILKSEISRLIFYGLYFYMSNCICEPSLTLLQL